jgi:NAD(P)-dependent dehydrogenase (short-subunit alcohol dehydrogenase family)
VNKRIVIITGAGSGIGRATALLAAAQGYKVAALDIHGERASEAAAEALAQGAPAALGIACDVGDEAQIAAAMAQVQAELGAPYGVFANAGIEINQPAHEMPVEVWERVLTTNLTGVFLTCKHALRLMLAAQQGGSIVCTSSPSAFVGWAGGSNAAYGASKGGITAMVRALALDYARHGIRVNAVVPGATDTPMLYTHVPPEDQPALRKAIDARAAVEIPLGRLAQPAEIAQAVLWLLSDAAAYVTGSHLVCDGGLLAKSANTD